jgi:hypothetical protein
MPASDQPMTSMRLSAYIGGGALLVGWLAAAASAPVSEVPPARDRAQPAATSGSSSIASEVEAQASKLRARLSQAPTPSTRPRNPFSFAARRTVRATTVPAKPAADAAAPATPVVPALLLMGIAEDPSPDGPRRTAVIGGAADTLYMVVTGQRIADRYEVTTIGSDAVELKDLLTGGYRRLALR